MTQTKPAAKTINQDQNTLLYLIPYTLIPYTLYPYTLKKVAISVKP
jgi:hypothetical protein